MAEVGKFNAFCQKCEGSNFYAFESDWDGLVCGCRDCGNVDYFDDESTRIEITCPKCLNSGVTLSRLTYDIRVNCEHCEYTEISE